MWQFFVYITHLSSKWSVNNPWGARVIDVITTTTAVDCYRPVNRFDLATDDGNTSRDSSKFNAVFFLSLVNLNQLTLIT